MERDRLWALFAEVEPSLVRYPARFATIVSATRWGYAGFFQ